MAAKFGEISIVDYVAPAKAAHEYAPLVTSLINAGPDKVATATFADEDIALAFLRAVQVAAREQNVSAVKRLSQPSADGKGYTVGVAVRAKITRNRKPVGTTDGE